MHAHGLKPEDLRRVADGPTSTLGAHRYRLSGLVHAFRTTGRLCESLHFHTMGMLAGERCYIRWHVEPDGLHVVAFALLRDGRWEAACDPAHASEHDWPGGLWLAATHRIGEMSATLQEVRAVSIALLDRSRVDQQPCDTASAMQLLLPLPELGEGCSEGAGSLQEVRAAPMAPLSRSPFDQQLDAACAAQVRQRVPGRKRGKGRKPAAVQVTLRLAPDVLARWRATGPGWHSRMVAQSAQPDAAAGTPAPRRTRSAKGQGGVLVSLRIPPLALARWRATGAGWQSRIAALLAQPV